MNGTNETSSVLTVDDKMAGISSVRLPVGIKGLAGEFFRSVVVDQMRGFDEELISEPGVKNNGGKAMTVLLQRCILSIDGLVEKKKNPQELIDAEIVRQMTQADRDALVMHIHMLTTRSTKVDITLNCPECRTALSYTRDLKECPIIEWPDGKEKELSFELPEGFYIKDRLVKKGVIKFPDGRIQESIAPLARINPGKAQTAILAACISKMEGEFSVDTEIVKALSTFDRLYLTRLIQSDFPGMKTHKTEYCDNCGFEIVTEVNPAAFFDIRRANRKK